MASIAPSMPPPVAQALYARCWRLAASAGGSRLPLPPPTFPSSTFFFPSTLCPARQEITPSAQKRAEGIHGAALTPSLRKNNNDSVTNDIGRVFPGGASEDPRLVADRLGFHPPRDLASTSKGKARLYRLAPAIKVRKSALCSLPSLVRSCTCGVIALDSGAKESIPIARDEDMNQIKSTYR